MLRGEMSHFFPFLLKQILFTCIQFCVYVSNKKELLSKQEIKMGLFTPLLIFLSFGGGLFIQKLYLFLGFFHANTMAHRIIKQEIKMGLFVSMLFFFWGGGFSLI